MASKRIDESLKKLTEILKDPNHPDIIYLKRKIKNLCIQYNIQIN
jgi:hypothetical protein